MKRMQMMTNNHLTIISGFNGKNGDLFRDRSRSFHPHLRRVPPDRSAEGGAAIRRASLMGGGVEPQAASGHGGGGPQDWAAQLVGTFLVQHRPPIAGTDGKG